MRQNENNGASKDSCIQSVYMPADVLWCPKPTSFKAVIKGWGPGNFPSYFEVYPRLLWYKTSMLTSLQQLESLPTSISDSPDHLWMCLFQLKIKFYLATLFPTSSLSQKYLVERKKISSLYWKNGDSPLTNSGNYGINRTRDHILRQGNLDVILEGGFTICSKSKAGNT